MSVVFKWNEQEMTDLLASCSLDDTWPLIKEHFAPGSRLLEAGCGSGRWVRFLTDKGYEVAGLEYNSDAVAMVKTKWKDLEIVQGDCESSPFPDGSFDGALSFGVIEHWIEGPEKPLADLFRVLKPGAKVLITVPCLNTVRKIKRLVFFDEIKHSPIVLARWIIRRRLKPLSRMNNSYLYAVYPSWGEFFEYRFTTQEFSKMVREAGFVVDLQVPSARLDGIYHELNPFGLFIKFKNWQFTPTLIASFIDSFLSKWAFAHPHMQAIIAHKPLLNTTDYEK